MDETMTAPREAMKARLNRFALCVASDTDAARHATDWTDGWSGFEARGGPQTLYREVLERLSDFEERGDPATGMPPRSIVARFSYLPYEQRAAFALVVIEEFSIGAAADIMDIPENKVRSFLLDTRDFLFSGAWTTRADS